MDGWSHHLELSFENSGQGKHQVQRGRKYSRAINVLFPVLHSKNGLYRLA